MITKEEITVRKALPKDAFPFGGKSKDPPPLLRSAVWGLCRRRLTEGPLLSRRSVEGLRCDALDTTAGRTCVSVLGVGGVGGPVRERTGHRSIGERRQNRVQATRRGPGNSRILRGLLGTFKVKAGKRGKSPR